MPTFANGTPLVTVRGLLNDTGLRKNDYAAQEDPTPDYDERFGWEPGSRILAGGVEWICKDATAGAAVWVPASDESAVVIATEAKNTADGAVLDAATADAKAVTAYNKATAADAKATEAQAAAVAAAMDAAYFDTIAEGRAAVADGEAFGVVAGGPDGLTRPTIYRRDDASSQTLLVQIVAPAEVDGEVAARRAVITDQTVEYMLEFVAKSAVNTRLRYLLGGFRGSDGAFEATKIIGRSFSSPATSGRWVDFFASNDGGIYIAADYRGRVRLQPDEATLDYIADNLPVTIGDYPMLTSGSATFYKPMGPIIGIVAYGQSWEARNGQGSPAQNDVNGYTLTGARYPRNALTLDDGRGWLGWEGSTSRTDATAFVAGFEADARIQTITGAMAFRLAKTANDEGRPLVVMARTEARGETPIEELMPLDMEGALDGGPWAAWLGAVQNAYDIAQELGVGFELRFIPWTHGQNNIDDSYADYRSKVEALFDRMSADAMAITGQTIPPQFLIMQQPSSQNKGYSDTFKVVSDLCRERDDCTLVSAGYGHSMIDLVHLDRWGTVAEGELRAITVEKHLRGEPWGSPQLANPQRSGAVITFDVIGAHDVVADESIVSDRHQIGGTYDSETGVYSGGVPVPNLGFEASLNGAAATIASVVVDRRRITVTLASTPTSGTLQVRYAMYNDNATTSARGDGRSANRGNIRADWIGYSNQRPERRLYRWLASDYFNFTV